MNSFILNWFSGFATFGAWLYFLAGFGFAYAQACVRAKLRHKDLRLPWRLAGVAIGISAMFVVTMQTQIAYTTAKETAQEVQDCQREYNRALVARAQITSENDELSQIQRKIVFDWIHALLFPPPPFDKLPPGDPRRQEYGLTLTFHTERDFQKSLNRQDQLQDYRDHHPLPDPTCGK
jgi:hypothetical protein